MFSLMRLQDLALARDLASLGEGARERLHQLGLRIMERAELGAGRHESRALGVDVSVVQADGGEADGRRHGGSLRLESRIDPPCPGLKPGSVAKFMA